MSERIFIRERRITQPCAERLSSQQGAYLQKTSYARKFKELITHTPTAGVAGGALNTNSPANSSAILCLRFMGPRHWLAVPRIHPRPDK
jgi:hypothetical protein